MTTAAGSAAAVIEQRADQVAQARRTLVARLDEGRGGWRGYAADAAAARVQDLSARALRAAEALADAGGVLRAYAREVESADELRRRAALLLRSGTDPELVFAAERLRAEADASTELAARRAAAALHQLQPPVAAHRSQTRGFAGGLWSVVADTVMQGWDLDPHLIALHPHAWWAAASASVTGTFAAARHPRRATAAALGLDQLRDHAYGEWAGTMLGTAITGFDTGGAGRAASVARRLEREAQIVAADGSWAVRRVSTLGGRVRPRAGLTLPQGFPKRIKDLADATIQHILVGDERGGGHRSGVGRPGKTEFPPTWSDDDIIRRAMETATRPESVQLQENGNYRLERRFGDVTVRVAVAQDGQVITAHPLKGGVGVVQNRRRTSG